MKNMIQNIVRKHLAALTSELSGYPTVVIEEGWIDFNEMRVTAMIYCYPEVGEEWIWSAHISGRIGVHGTVKWD